MIPVDAGFVYPKTGLDADLRMDLTPRFVSSGSYYLDGSGDFIDTDGLTVTTDESDFSISFWMKIGAETAQPTAIWRPFGFKNTSTSHRLELWNQSDEFKLLTNNGNGDVTTTAWAVSPGVYQNGWSHFAFSCDWTGSAMNATLYINGQSHGAVAMESDVDLSAANASSIGGGYDGSSSVKGNFCHFGVWHAALTQAQVRDLMTATTYAEAVTKGGSTPRAYYLLEANTNDSVETQNGSAQGNALAVGDRCRLPNGFDLTGNRIDARCFSGRSIAFDGSADHLENSHPISTTASTAQTMICWVKADDWTAGNIISNATSSSNNSLFIYSQNNNLGIHCRTASTTTKVGCSFVPSVGVWHHVAATFDTSDAANPVSVLYVNGKDASGTGLALATGGNDGLLEIGGSGAAQNIYFEGSIADVKLFDVVLTAAQVLELYENPELAVPTGVSTGDLIHHFPLCDFDIAGSDGLNGLYAQNLAQPNKPLLCTGGTMEFAQSGIPQLGLRSSSSRMLIQDDEIVTISSDAAINIFSGADGGGTVAFWIFANSDGESSHGRVLWKSGDYELMTRNESSGTCELQLEVSGFSGGTAIHRSAKSISIGAWTHVVMTYTGLYNANPIFYINGAATTNAADTQTTGTFTDSGDLVLGNKSDGSRSMDGILSEVSLWSSILDADAVTVLYNSGVQGFDPTSDSGDYDVSSDLTAFYRLDNPEAIADLSANSNTGTVAGTPNMATVPEGTTAGLSTFGAITTETVGSSKINFPFMQDVNSTQLQGYLEHKCPTWGTGEYCVAFWLRTTHLSGGATHYFWDIRGSTNSYGMRIYASATNNILWKPKGAGSGEVAIYPAPSSGTVTDGAWHFVALQRLGATSQKWHWRRITDASFNTGTNSTGFGDMTDAGTAYINGSSSATSPSGGQMAMPRIYIGKSFSDNEIGNMFEQGKRILLGDTL